MIISASRRTDIPAYYSEWFLNRLKERYVLIPNPRNADRLGRVELSPDNVDCIVFWTKNPAPMLDRLDTIEKMGYPFYFQFTLTPYGRELEPNLPPKSELLQTFLELSRRIGPERVVWRYDPVLITGHCSVAWHLERFRELCGELHDATRCCVFSFIDPYAHIGKEFHGMSRGEMLAVAESFSEIAADYPLSLFTCAEEIDLSRFGIGHSACIDQKLIERIIGCPIWAKKDAGQRAACGCIESVDIGAYNTCPNGCAYCYATTSENTVRRRIRAHDPTSPLLAGVPRGDELITDRTAPSQKLPQLSLF
jgi:Domain of unknown function (DUF1848).